MNLIRLCLHRPVGVSVGVLLVVLFGLLSLFAIPVQLTPNVDTPIISVQTRWLGANPQEMEREVIDRQEEMLRSVKGLRKMTSESRDNRGTIRLEFYPDVNKETALRDVTDKLRQVSGYPLEVDQPTVQAADAAAETPIAWLVLHAKNPDEEEQVRELEDFAEDYIKPYLDRVPGVAEVDIYGGKKREMQVRVEAGALAARGLTVRDVVTALRGQNTNVSAGARAQGKRDYTVRTVGQYASAEEILDTVIAYTPGGPVYVRDVAEVELSFRRPISFVRARGKWVLSLPVRREVGSNVITVMEGIKDAVRRANDEVLRARGLELELTQVYDETVYIHQSIAMVQWNIVIGGALATAVLLLFLRDWRATLVVALAIPVTVIGTFVAVVAFGRTLNVISLAGMAFAVGMVVDNAVVVLENIYRHRQMGKATFQAAMDGANEVWGAVLASTLTTMAVFIPVIFVREEAGQLFRDISIAIATAVGLSLIVSVTVIPTLAARLLGVRQPRAIPASERHPTGRVAAAVATVVERVNLRPRFRLALIVLMAGGALGLARLLIPDATYLPAGNRNLVFGFLLTPPGYTLAEFERIARTIENGIQAYWEVDPGSEEHRQLDNAWREQTQRMIDANAIPDLAQGDGKRLSWLERDRIRREWLTPPPLIDNFFLVSFNGGCFMGASSRDPQRVKPLVRLLQRAAGGIPGVFPIFYQTQLFTFGGGNTADIQIRGDNLDQVIAAASAMYMECNTAFGQPRPSPTNFNLGRPELQVVPDRERAADLGLTAADVGQIVEAAVDGVYVGDYRLAGGDTIDLRLLIQGQLGEPTQKIGQVPLYTPVGGIVPLSAAVRLIDTTALEQINHVERQRAVTLTVNPPEAMALEAVIRQIKEEIEPKLRQEGRIAPGVLISLTGNADKLVAARNAMVGEWQGLTLKTLANIAGSRFFLSVIIVYLLMAALYESWIYPFVIMFSVPLAVFGGFLGLSIAHWGTLLSSEQPVQQLDVLTFLGFVILVGIVVNNAILLVDQSLQNLRLHGLRPVAAVREAARVRVRPVLMTSLTTIFGQIPLALFPGAGSELYRGLAAVMVGGLLIATVGTLILVPSVLGLVLDLRERIVRAFGGAAAPVPEPHDR